jgi:adenosylcobinamide-GDP ribazoletransferase
VTGLRGALGLLTVVGGGGEPSPAASSWFAPVGLALGAVLGLVWWGGAGSWFPPLVAAALVVAADLALTGMLHLDGTADAADGLLPHLSRERRLAVMATPDVGAFGVGVAALSLLLRTVALAGTDPRRWHAVLALAGLWGLSRGLMALAIERVPPARPGGMTAAFRGGRLVPVAIGVLAATGVLAAGRGWPGVIAALLGIGGAAGVLALATRRIGGVTGDVLGAAGTACEVVGLVVLSARW